jgi:NADPH:quinone reductase-like Zn-dependent oxidoreductase
VSIEERPLPKLEHPDDALIKVTTAAICGSDLHMYQGRTAAQGGLCFGTQILGAFRFLLGRIAMFTILFHCLTSPGTLLKG